MSDIQKIETTAAAGIATTKTDIASVEKWSNAHLLGAIAIALAVGFILGHLIKL